MIIGLISDTHGLIRENAIDELKGSDLIIHAGDIGNVDIISKISDIAKLEFVKGNCDKNIDKDIGEYNRIIEIDNTRIYLTHDINKLEKDMEKGEIDFKKENIDIVIYGHSHKCNIFTKSGILYINPGSIGPRRFKLPVMMAKLYIDDSIKKKVEKNIYNSSKTKKAIVLKEDEKIGLDDNYIDKCVYIYENFMVEFINLLN